MTSNATLIGRVRRVQGSHVHVELETEPSSGNPIIRGRLYKPGQVGSFVKIPIGIRTLYGVVSEVGAKPGNAGEDDQEISNEDSISVELVGEVISGGDFRRGIGVHPTIDDPVHVVREDDLKKIYGNEGGFSVPIGVHIGSESLAASLRLRKLVTRHSCILGATGSGKSNAVAAIVKNTLDQGLDGARFVIIDPHGEYTGAFPGSSRLFSIDGPGRELKVPHWALHFDEWLWSLLGVSPGTAEDQAKELRKRVADAKRRFCQAHLDDVACDQVTSDSPIPFDLAKLWHRLVWDTQVTYCSQDRERPAVQSIGNPDTLEPPQFEAPGAGQNPPFKPRGRPPRVRGATNDLLNRLKDIRYTFLTSPSPYDGEDRDLDELLEEWFGHADPVIIFDLSGVPSDVVDVTVGAVSRLLFLASFWGEDSGIIGSGRPTLLVYEEAHTYLPDSSRRFVRGHALSAAQSIFREGRKYGLGAMAVSQRPSELDSTVLSQCGTFVTLRTSNSQDQSIVRASFPESLEAMVSLLPSLRTGEALIVGESVPIPSRVDVDLVQPGPGGGDPPIADAWRELPPGYDNFADIVKSWRETSQPGQEMDDDET